MPLFTVIKCHQLMIALVIINYVLRKIAGLLSHKGGQTEDLSGPFTTYPLGTFAPGVFSLTNTAWKIMSLRQRPSPACLPIVPLS